jgi:hypothetical protein
MLDKKINRFNKILKIKSSVLGGYTIVESITALLIITISFGAGMSIYGQINVDIIKDNNVIIRTILDRAMTDTKKNHFFTDDSFIIDDVRVVRKIEIYDSQTKLIKISFSALSVTDDTEIYKISEIIYP